MITILDNWYSTNLLNTDYEDYISDTLFCNDRRLRSEVGGSPTGGGYGQIDTYYAVYQRLDTTKAPDIRCVQNDRFTVSDTTIGNGALTYPIGLLTADETSLAGLHRTIDNTTNYLHINHDWWTMSPGYFQGGTTDIAKAFGIVDTSKIVSILYVTDVRGVRPVINLKPNIKATGTGTTSDPYKVVGLLN